MTPCIRYITFNWKGCGMKQSWPALKYCFRNVTGRARKLPGRDLNPGPPEYEAGSMRLQSIVPSPQNCESWGNPASVLTALILRQRLAINLWATCNCGSRHYDGFTVYRTWACYWKQKTVVGSDLPNMKVMLDCLMTQSVTHVIRNWWWWMKWSVSGRCLLTTTQR
jgi:hypothetical protein